MVNNETGTRVAQVSHLSPAQQTMPLAHGFLRQRVWVLIFVFAFVCVLMVSGYDGGMAVSVTLAAGLTAERISRSLTGNRS